VRGYALWARKVDVRLPRNGNSNSRGARPDHLIITVIKWDRTSRLSIKNSLSLGVMGYDFRVTGHGLCFSGVEKHGDGLRALEGFEGSGFRSV